MRLCKARFAARFTAVILVVAIACQPSQAIRCDELSPVVPHPRGGVVPGVMVGPLLVTTGMWRGLGRPELGWTRAEDLPKFLVVRIDRFEHPLTLVGRRCADGRALRFAESPPWAVGADLSPAEIERRTSPSRTIDPPPRPEVIVVGELPVYGGYFIFTAPGRWQIQARDGDRVLGAAVIEVRGPAGP